MNYYKTKTRLFAAVLPVSILFVIATFTSCNDTPDKAATTVTKDSSSTKTTSTAPTTSTTTMTKVSDSTIVNNRRGMMSTDPTDTSKDRGIKNPGKSRTGVKNPG